MARFTLFEDGVTPDIDMESDNEKEILETIKKLTDKRLKELERKEISPIWEELEELNGCYISPESKIVGNGKWRAVEMNQNTFIDAQHAKAAIAMARISQLMPYYGGRITSDEWRDKNLRKYAIYRGDDNILKTGTNFDVYRFVTFHTPEQREAFMSREENIQLLKDYFMIQD